MKTIDCKGSSLFFSLTHLSRTWPTATYCIKYLVHANNASRNWMTLRASWAVFANSSSNGKNKWLRMSSNSSTRKFMKSSKSTPNSIDSNWTSSTRSIAIVSMGSLCIIIRSPFLNYRIVWRKISPPWGSFIESRSISISIYNSTPIRWSVPIVWICLLTKWSLRSLSNQILIRWLRHTTVNSSITIIMFLPHFFMYSIYERISKRKARGEPVRSSVSRAQNFTAKLCTWSTARMCKASFLAQVRSYSLWKSPLSVWIIKQRNISISSTPICRESWRSSPVTLRRVIWSICFSVHSNKYTVVRLDLSQNFSVLGQWDYPEEENQTNGSLATNKSDSRLTSINDFVLGYHVLVFAVTLRASE